MALKIFLNIPVTTDTCERSLSKLKFIKNYLRSTTSQNRLTKMAILSLENSLANKLSFYVIIDDFAAIKARKVQF